MMMKKMSILGLFILSVFFMQAQGITGVWITVDDESGEEKSHIEIYEQDGKYFGKVIKLLPAATTDVCIDCPGDKNGKNLLEINIVENLEPYKDYYSYGTITDPGDGKVYKCSAWVEGDILKVRGYIGISALGRNQLWKRLK